MINKTKWCIDKSHSQIVFMIRHMMIANVSGFFRNYESCIYTNKSDFSNAEIDVWIDPTSIDTGDTVRDQHLIGEGFFDVLHHKQINFTSQTIKKKKDSGVYELWGDLSMKGITKHILLLVEFGHIAKDSYGKEKMGIHLTGKINRSDWGLTWNSTTDTGDLLIGEEIQISCEMELVNYGFVDDALVVGKSSKSKTI